MNKPTRRMPISRYELQESVLHVLGNNYGLLQMAKIDENQEVIACICMAIDNYDRACQLEDAKEEEIPDSEELHKSDAGKCHWILGVPGKITTAKNLEQDFQQELKTLFWHFN